MATSVRTGKGLLLFVAAAMKRATDLDTTVAR